MPRLTRFSRLIPALPGLFLCACSLTLPIQGPIAGGTYEFPLAQDARGWSRSALLHLPPADVRPEHPPLVIVLHGAFSTGAKMEEETGFSKLADREGFFVAYPQGIGLFGFLQHWNAGFCCGKAEADDFDDVGTILRLIDRVAARFPIDRSRVYLVGMSNGGMLTYRFAAEYPRVVAAAAVMAGAIGGTESGERRWILPKPAAPVPIMILHGLDDRNIPYDGGVAPAKGGERVYDSVAEAAAFWAAADGCDAVLNELGSDQRLVRRSWRGCRDGSSVELIPLPGLGHVWPSRTATSQLPPDNPLHNFDGSETIWSFLKTFRRPVTTEP